MGTIEKVFAENLRRLRKKAGLKQAKLAERADTSVTAIQHYETNRRFPKMEYIGRLARALGVPETALFQDPDLRPEPPTPSLDELLAVIRRQESRIQELESGQKTSPPGTRPADVSKKRENGDISPDLAEALDALRALPERERRTQVAVLKGLARAAKRV